jgi:3-hydroxybutyryl-CoA dehydrogenase
MMDSKDVKKAAVVGAGVMGNSIAQVFAQAGMEVGLVDVDERALERALDLIRSSLDVLVEFGRVDPGKIDAIIDRIEPSTDLELSCRGADFILEAVPEIPEVKKKVFAQLEDICPDNVVIASNTSGLDIFSMAEMTRPERLIIAHWYAPPHIIPLVEVVQGPSTDPEVTSFTAALMERLGKKPIVMRQFTRGFIANKIQNAMTLAIIELLLGGFANPEEIDQAVKHSLGIRLPIVGVVQTLDFTGLDVAYDIMRSYGLSLPFFEEKIAAGHLGAKTSKGFYDYGGRSEKEILRKRDTLYLKMLDHLEETGAFGPV